MNIIVLVKQTFDTEEKIAIQDGKVVEEGVSFVVNPYDEYAIEEAVKIKETLGADVTVLSIGPARVENAIRTALAMGADQAVLIEEEELPGDEQVLAKVLAAAIRNRPFDLILAGNTSVDNGAGQVALRLAEELNIPHVSTAVKLSVESGKAVVARDVEGNLEVIEAPLPLLVTAQQGLNEPRYPSLPGVMKAKKKPLERVKIADLGLSPEDLTPRVDIVDQYLRPERKAGKILSGDLAAQTKELVQLLHNEAKVV